MSTAALEGDYSLKNKPTNNKKSMTEANDSLREDHREDTKTHVSW